MRCCECWEPTETAPCTGCGANPLLDGRYRLLAPIAAGAVGQTWRAEQVTDDAVVAIKEMPYRRARSPKERDLLAREAAVLAQLSHPGIPALRDAFVAGTGRSRAMYLVLEYVEGHTLDEEARTHRFDEGDVLRILDELLDILTYLHDRSPPVIHRDVKPRNVMRRRDGRLVLVDFGSVRDALRDPDLGGSTVAGTFGFMAPEQFHGDATPTTDLFGLGALAIALWTRRDPASLQDWTQRFRWRPHATVSAQAADLVDRLVSADPAGRPESARAARDQVRACLRTVPSSGLPIPAAPLPAPAPPRPTETLTALLQTMERTRGITVARPEPRRWLPAVLAGTMVVGVTAVGLVAAGAGLALSLVSGGGSSTGLAATTLRILEPFTQVPVTDALPEAHGTADFGEALTRSPRVQACFDAHDDPSITGATLELRLRPPSRVDLPNPHDPTLLESCVVLAARQTQLPAFRTARERWVTVRLERRGR